MRSSTGRNVGALPLGVVASLLFGYACALVFAVLFPLIMGYERAKAAVFDGILGTIGLPSSIEPSGIDDMGRAAMPWCLALGMHLVAERSIAQRQPFGTPATTLFRVGWAIGMLLFVCSGFAMIEV
jgi:hypothetical protein